MNNVKKGYLPSIVNVRGILILLVVIGHACSVFTANYAGHLRIESTIGDGIRTIIYSFHMATYMAISGYLFFFEVQKAKEQNWDKGLIDF